MTEKIAAHIDALFKHAPPTRRVSEAREELLAGCLDKYADLTDSGRSPEEAYRAVISGIGDVDELLRAIGRVDASGAQQDQRKKRALFISAGVFLYVLSIAAVGVMEAFVPFSELSVAVFLLLIALATFVLLYGVLSTRVKVEKPSVSLSGEIQEQLAGSGQGNKLLSAVSSSLWSILTLVYLCGGLFLNFWHPGWLIFPLGAILQILVNMIFGKNKYFRANLHGLIWTLTAFIYLTLSFLTDRWDITWLIFPLALSFQQGWNLIRVWRDSNEK